MRFDYSLAARVAFKRDYLKFVAQFVKLNHINAEHNSREKIARCCSSRMTTGWQKMVDNFQSTRKLVLLPFSHLLRKILSKITRGDGSEIIIMTAVAVVVRNQESGVGEQQQQKNVSTLWKITLERNRFEAFALGLLRNFSTHRSLFC